MGDQKIEPRSQNMQLRVAAVTGQIEKNTISKFLWFSFVFDYNVA